MDQTNSAIFYRNYLSRMIRYHTQATYRGTKPCTELIQAANQMSRLIDPQRPKRPTEEQKASLRQEAEIQALYRHWVQLYHRIQTLEFKFVYQAKDSRFTTSIRKPNAPWNGSSKYESGDLKSRFKQNTTPLLLWMILKRNSSEIRSRLIKLFLISDRFGTLSWKELVLPTPSSICRQRLMPRAMWISGS